jgi:hypothetical protein
MGIGDKILEYLYLKKRDPNAPTGTGIKFMNGVNRISLIMFLFALIVIIIKTLFFKRH